MAAARALVVEAGDQIPGETDSFPYLATHSQTHTPARSLAYTATRALPHTPAGSAGARRGLIGTVDEITIDEFAAPRRCQARRAMDPVAAAQSAVLVAAIAGPVARAAEVLRAAQAAEAEPATEALETTAILAVGSTLAPEPSAFVARRVRRRRGTMGILGLAAAITFTGVGISVQAVSASDIINPDAIFATADQEAHVASRVDMVTRDSARPDLREMAASQPVMALTAEPSIEGVFAPGQRAPKTPAEAIATAQSMVGNQNYGNMCLALVSAFYGYTSAGIASAQDAAGVAAAAGMMHTDMSDIPVGALIWYDGGPVGNPYGHVAMYAGDGMIYSNGASTGVGLMSINVPADSWHEPIIGWSAVWLPNATK